MIWNYISYFLSELLPRYFSFLDSLMITGDVSFLQLMVAVILLCVVIGAILLRV